MDVIKEAVYGTKRRTKLNHTVIRDKSGSSSENDYKSQRSGPRINKLDDPSILFLSSEDDDEEEEVKEHIYHPKPKVSRIILPEVKSNSKTLTKKKIVNT